MFFIFSFLILGNDIACILTENYSSHQLFLHEETEKSSFVILAEVFQDSWIPKALLKVEKFVILGRI